MKDFMKALWRLLFHEAAEQGKNRNKTRGNHNQHIELLSCMTDRHTENMCAGILTWGWSRRTCNFFAQGLVHEGGGKNRQLGVVCFIHADKLVPQNKLDDKPWCWSFAHHMRGAVCDCPCPKWSSLGIPTHHGTSSPPPLHALSNPPDFQNNNNNNKQFDKRKAAVWRRKRSCKLNMKKKRRRRIQSVKQASMSVDL